MLLLAILALPLFTSCAAMLPDIAKITHDICDSVVCVEVDRDAFKQDTDVHIIVDVINKDIPKSKIAAN